MLDRVLASIDSRRAAAVESLSEFLRFPSVSSRPEHAGDMARCARWLAGQFFNAGLHTSVEPTPGHPIVLAKNQHRPGRPTVLLYGHYDVQPVDPLDQWLSPPFEPAVRKTDAGTDAIYARGAADDKGQVWAHVEAALAWQSHGGGVPVNLVVLVEGEEEIDSHHLEAFVNARRDELRADVAVISDTNQFARGRPALTCGLRGLVFTEVIVTSTPGDLHSGIYGGAVPNPALVLSRLLASLHDDLGRVRIPGFYDDVRLPAEAERRGWHALGFDDAAFAATAGARALAGEAGFSTVERRWSRPTLDVNGLTSGYQGPGAKTIVPARASAKVSMRLVPDQDPRRVQEQFERAMRERCPDAVGIEFVRHAAAPPVLVPADGPLVAAASRAVEAGFGTKPVLVREGLTIPVVQLLKRTLGIDALLVGFGLPDDRPHAPNEKFDVDALHAGARTAAALYDELARLRR